MDKLTLAHDAALAMIKSGCSLHTAIADAWRYANAMQDEADERINKERPAVLLTKDKDGNCLHFHHEFGHKKCMDCGASLEEWQPDWSQAPDDVGFWRVSEIRGAEWVSVEDGIAWYKPAPLFDYQGSWQDSLRKRPE